MSHRPCPAASPVSRWIQSTARHQPLAERTVLELSRRVQRWQQYPGGPSHAPTPIRRSALRARDQLVSHNLRLISHTWSRHRSSLPRGQESSADALQEAALNLVRAAEKFDPSKGYRFSSYATFWVRRGFSDQAKGSRRTIRFPAEKAALMVKAERLIDAHQGEHGHTPSLSWLADQLNGQGAPIQEERLRELLVLWTLTRTDSLDSSPRGDDTPTSTNQRSCMLQIAAPDTHAAAMDGDVESTDHKILLETILGQLNQQEERLIRLRYLRRPALSPAQLRRAMGNLQQSDVEQLEATAIGKLREYAHTSQANTAPKSQGAHASAA